MDWLINLSLFLVTYVISCLSRYLFLPLIKFASWYMFYFFGAITFNVLYKLRYEVYNEDLKFKRAECEKRVVLVTGATSGIGLAAARYFYTKGFVVVACYYSRDEPGYNELNNLTSLSSGVHQCSMYLVKLDVRSEESIEECYKQVRIILSNNPKLQLYALLNVAGIGYFYKFQWFTKAMIRNMVETNLMGAMLITRQFLHLLIKGSEGRVVNVASPLAYLPVEFNSVYGATKAGLTQFTNTLEVDLLSHNIKTCTIHPGNLIQNTSIAKSSLKAKLEMVMSELSNEEKELYKDDLDKHLKYMNKVERSLNRSDYMRWPQTSSLLSQVKRFVMITTGAIPGTRLDQNDEFMRSFDNAIRLKDPPKEMAAGNMFFNLISASMFEQISRALCRDIGLMLQRKRVRFVL